MPSGQPPQYAASQPSPLLATGHRLVLPEPGKAGPLLLPTARWGYQLGPWKQGAKPFQATCGTIQDLHTFHTEASLLWGVTDTATPGGWESAQQTLPSLAQEASLTPVQNPVPMGLR